MDVRKRIKKQEEERENENEEIWNDGKEPIKWSTCQKCLLLLFSFITTCFILFPLLFYSSSTLRQHVMFMNYIDFSPRINYSDPNSLGLQCCKNFYLQSNNDSLVGVWHLLPRSVKDKKCDHKGFDDDNPVILYLHGSGGNRGARHRVAMYKVLTQSIIDAHVVTLDYRGFGDSTNSYVSVDTVVTDAEVVYKWILERVKISRIYVWGHSMGAAVALKLLSVQSNVHATGLIMEAPFTNCVDALRDFPLTVLYRHMPFFQHFFAEPFQSEDTYFDNVALIGNISFPVLILHARDDSQIPYHQGKLLHETALQNDNYNVRYIEYDMSLGYDHLHIARDPDLPNKIISFMRLSTGSLNN